METYKTTGTCSRAVTFDVTEDGKVENVRFEGGCRGNTQGVGRLAEGRNIDDVIAANPDKVAEYKGGVIAALSGIECRNGTSCPDQLAKALKEYKAAHAK